MSKYGGFIDSNGNNRPDLVTEWDSKVNLTAADGTVTSMHLELGRKLDEAEVKRALAGEFWRLWTEFVAGTPH